MKLFLLILIAILWIPLTYWTISYFKKFRNQPNGSSIYQRGVLGFGIPFWLVEITFTAAIIPDRDIYSLFLWATILYTFRFHYACGPVFSGEKEWQQFFQKHMIGKPAHRLLNN